MIAFEDAYRIVMDQASPPTDAERVPLCDALDRIVASSYHSPIDVPGYNNSAMDGYAVRVSEVALDNPLVVSQRIPAGTIAQALTPNSVARIFTGAMVPGGADAIILQEDTLADGTSNQTNDAQTIKQVRFTELPKSDQHIRLAGQDIAKDAIVVKQGTRLAAGDIGLLASVGVAELDCYKPVRVAFFSTGDELKNPGETLGLGQIYNSNRYFLAASIRALGAIPVDLGCCPDSAEATREMLEHASQQADCIVTTGGMSVGEEDHVRNQLEIIGDILFWKIAIKPGKPVAFGHIRQSANSSATPFFGLPGNPVSSFVTFHLLVRPWLLKIMGHTAPQGKMLSAVAKFDSSNRGKRLDFLRGSAAVNNKGELEVELFNNQSSGVLSSIAESNVLVPVKPGQAIRKGELCEVMVLSASGDLRLANAHC